MRKLYLSLAVFFLFLISLSFVSAAAVINSVKVNDTDNFYSNNASNSIVHIVANVSGINDTGWVIALFQNRTQGGQGLFGTVDCGNGYGNVTLNNLTYGGTIFNGSCDVGAEALVNIFGQNGFMGGPIIIAATNISTEPPQAQDFGNATIVLYNMTGPPQLPPEGGDPSTNCTRLQRFGSLTTNFVNVLDFAHVNFIIQIEMNGSCMHGPAGGSSPWNNFEQVMMMNFTSLNMSNESIGQRLAHLNEYLQVDITPPHIHGPSRVWLNETAFSELNTNTKITLNNVPFSASPDITSSDPSHNATNVTFEMLSPFDFTVQLPSPHHVIVPKGNIIFNIAGFSEWKPGDNTPPVITINSPTGNLTSGTNRLINVTVNGTKTDPRRILISLNQNLNYYFDGEDPFLNNTANCNNITNNTEVVNCLIGLDLEDGNYNLNVTVLDFGGPNSSSPGNYNSSNLLFSVHTPAPSTNIGSGSGNSNTTEWRMFGRTLDHNRYYPGNVNMTGFGKIWDYTTGGNVDSSPAIANGILYIGSDDNRIYALDASTGVQIWNFTTGDKIGWSSPAVADGIVYIGSNDKKLYALNASTGAHLWNYTTGDVISSSPTVANGILYIGSNDKNLSALDAANGSLIWRYIFTDIIEVSSVAVSGGIVYIGLDDKNLYALNASTGVRLWNYTADDLIWSSPAVANGVVYVGSSAGTLFALYASNGTKLWNYTTENGIFDSSPAVANGIVYFGVTWSGVGNTNYNFYALYANNGTKLWNYTTPDGIFLSSPVVTANGIVFVGADAHPDIYAFNASTGIPIWSFNTTLATIYSSPAIANGIVYIGSKLDNKTYAFGPKDITAPVYVSSAINGTSTTYTQPYTTTYSPSNVSFSFTAIFSDSTLSTGILTFNGTNYSMSKSASTFNRTVSLGLAVGTYNYSFWANDTDGYNNQSAQFLFNVAKATTTLTILANNNTISNLTLTYPQQLNISATSSAGTVVMDRHNGTDWVSKLGENATNVSLAAGTYPYRFNVTGNANYTDVAYKYYTITINQATGIVVLYINNSVYGMALSSNITDIPINATLAPGNGTVMIYDNGALICNGTAPSYPGNYTNLTTLGLYNITAIYLGNVNYTASSITLWINYFNTTNSTIANASSINVTENISSVIVTANTTLQNVTIPATSTQSVTLDLSLVKNTTGNVTIPNNFTLMRVSSTTVNYTAIIPDNTTIVGGTSWDGKVILPIVNATTFTAPSGTTNIVVELGSSTELNFSKAVKIVISGMGGKKAAWSRGSTTLTDIATLCDAITTQPTNIHPNTSPRECYTTSANNDLVIWTYHFTSFAAYTPAVVVTGDGGGGGSVSGTSYTWTSVAAGTTAYKTFNETIDVVKNVSVTALYDLYNVTVGAMKLSEKPTGIVPLNNLYSYLQITAYNAPISNISAVVIQFEVNTSWLNTNNFSKYNVKLWRYTNTWTELTTSLVEEKASTMIYKANSPGFSYFAITSSPETTIQREERIEMENITKGICGNNKCEADYNETQTSCCVDCGCPSGQDCMNGICKSISEETKKKATFLLWIVIGIVVALAIAIVIASFLQHKKNIIVLRE